MERDRRTHDLDYRALSKTISHALRHAPWLYELEPDPEGWVPLEALLASIRKHRWVWRDVGETEIRELMARADKQRFELDHGRIRALYGHSLPGGIAREASSPPSILYHGTSEAALPSILRDGLKPVRRQLVHLSTDIATAQQVARRRAGVSRVLQVDAAVAAAAGVRFYFGNPQVWLANEVPPRYLRPIRD